MTDDQYKEYVTTLRIGYAAAYVSNMFLEDAQKTLKAIGGYRLEQKKNINTALFNIQKLATLVDRNVQNSRKDVFSVIHGLDNILELLVGAIDDVDDEKKIVEFLTNMNKER